MNIQTEQMTEQASELVLSPGTEKVYLVNIAFDPNSPDPNNPITRKVIKAEVELPNPINGGGKLSYKSLRLQSNQQDVSPTNSLPVDASKAAEFIPPPTNNNIIRKFRSVKLKYQFEGSPIFEAGPYVTSRDNCFIQQFKLTVRHTDGTHVYAEISEQGPPRVVT